MRQGRALRSSLVALSVFAAFAASAVAQDQERRGRRPRMKDSAPKVGEVAPTFKLKTLDGKQEVELAKFNGKRPVVLFFGSYT